MDLETVIGLEIHVQLKTKSKMFCHCDNASQGAAPNTLICPICTGHPGTLPVPNRQAIRAAGLAALGLGCDVPGHAKFDRKHYTYPDLPKGYQITQFDEPIGVHGRLTIELDGQERTLRITRLHLEEDVGKLAHVGDETLIDYNRAGTPLIEIVTEPDLRTPAEARAFLQELRLTLRALGVSEADMEHGQLRCDANLSLRPVGDENLRPKTEIKNLNSFRSVERALAYEVERQRALWEAGTPPTQPGTRGWDEAAGQTREQREKEGAADYRFFPEPDIPPLHFTPEFLSELRAEMPELPSAQRRRFREQYGLTGAVADALVRDEPTAAPHDRPLAPYFEAVVTELREYAESELGTKGVEELWSDQRETVTGLVAKWLLNRISLEQRREHGLPVPPKDMARLAWMLHQHTVTVPVATSIHEAMVQSGGTKGPHELQRELGFERATGPAEMTAAVQAVLTAHPEVVAQYRAGKTAVLQFLIGAVMRSLKGAADAGAVRRALETALRRSS